MDRVEPSITGDAVCPRCGGYLAQVLDHFDELFGGFEPVTLDTPLKSVLDCDKLDIAERVEEMAFKLRLRIDWEAFEWCQTVEDLVRYLLSLKEREQ